MLHLDILGSAVAISMFLIVYYTLIGFSVLYFVFVFGFSTAQANSLGNWTWAFNAGALVLVGVLSDRLRVRKPLMVVGGLGAMAMTSLFAYQTYNVHTGYYTFVWILSVMAVFLGISFAPWMASFTETVEKRNPALIATGLAVWGWIIRAVISISIFILPYVVTTMTPLFENGPRAQAILASDPVARIVAAHPTLYNELARYSTCPPNPAAVPPALLQRAIAQVGIAQLTTVATAQCTNPTVKSDLAFLNAHGTQVQNALNAAPREWRTWWWVCVGCEVAFIPFVFVMAGRWSPRRARRDEQEHEQIVERELATLHAEGGVTPAET